MCVGTEENPQLMPDPEAVWGTPDPICILHNTPVSPKDSQTWGGEETHPFEVLNLGQESISNCAHLSTVGKDLK